MLHEKTHYGKRNVNKPSVIEIKNIYTADEVNQQKQSALQEQMILAQSGKMNLTGQ